MDSNKEVNIDGSCLNNIRFYDNLRPESETSSINSVLDEHQDDIILGLKILRVKYSNKRIMGHFNINFTRNKFELLSSIIGGKIDILMISETKLDATFPTNQLFIQGYSTVPVDTGCKLNIHKTFRRRPVNWGVQNGSK